MVGFAAMSLGQIAVVLIFVLLRGEPIGLGEAIKAVAGSGLALSLSVVAGLPATLAALWSAIRLTSTPVAEYLALRWPSWKEFLIGAVGLVVLVMGWELLSRVTGRASSPDFMVDVMKSAQSDGALWLLILGFSVAAPVSEEFLARGFLYYGWSETFLKVPGAICLSSLVWTALHLQYYELVLVRRGVQPRPLARLFALSQPIDLAHDRPARPEQSRCGGTEHLSRGELTRRSVLNRFQTRRKGGGDANVIGRNAFATAHGNAALAPHLVFLGQHDLPAIGPWRDVACADANTGCGTHPV